MPDHSDSLDLPQLAAAYRSGKTRSVDVISTVLECILHHGDTKVWIDPVPHAQPQARAAELENRLGENLPLHGVPFAIKDNINLSSRQTTTACPEFSHTPEANATHCALPPEVLAPNVARHERNVRLAVCGAHMYGLPLNYELTALRCTPVEQRSHRATACMRPGRFHHRVPAWFEVNAALPLNWKYGKCPRPGSATLWIEFPRRLISERSSWKTARKCTDSCVSIAPPSMRARLPGLETGVPTFNSAPAALPKARQE